MIVRGSLRELHGYQYQFQYLECMLPSEGGSGLPLVWYSLPSILVGSDTNAMITASRTAHQNPKQCKSGNWSQSLNLPQVTKITVAEAVLPSIHARLRHKTASDGVWPFGAPSPGTQRVCAGSYEGSNTISVAAHSSQPAANNQSRLTSVLFHFPPWRCSAGRGIFTAATVNADAVLRDPLRSSLHDLEPASQSVPESTRLGGHSSALWPCAGVWLGRLTA